MNDGCLDADHDKICGNESAFYPPLVSNVKAIPAGVVEHAFRGDGLGGTWSDSDRRGAYVGTFQVEVKWASIRSIACDRGGCDCYALQAAFCRG